MNKNSVCAIIITYNIGREFSKCFNSIYNQVDNVVIVDNNSDNETIEFLKELKNKENVEIIFNSDNYGIGKALNLAIEKVKYKYKWIITMDNDSEATPNMINTMLGAYNNLGEDEQEKVVSIFPSYLEKGYDKVEDIISNNENKNYKFIESEITSGNLLKSSLFDKIGIFKEELFIDYVDHEFCLRINKNGYKLIQSDGAVLLHSLGNSEKKNILNRSVTYTNHSELRRYYITRNRLHIWKQYKDSKGRFIEADKKAFIKETIKIVLLEDRKIEKLKMIFRGISDHRKNIYGKYIKKN